MAARRRSAAKRNWPDNLYQNNAGYFWYRNPLTKETFGLGRDFAVARDQVRVVNAELARKHSDTTLLARVAHGEKTLAEWCVEYEKMVIGNYREGSQSIGNSQRQIRYIREAEFAKREISRITPREVADFIKSLSERGTSVGGAVRTRLADVFREAILHGLIEHGKSPVDATLKPEYAVVRQRLSLENYLAMRDAAAKMPRIQWEMNAIDLALVTGQRREDVGLMEFEHVHDGYLWVQQEKTGARLKIPLSVGLTSVGLSLEGVIKRCRNHVVSRYIIHSMSSRGGGRAGSALSLASLSMAFTKLRDAAKIEVAEGKTPPTFHEIRSLSARLYAKEHGADFAQAILGHKSAKMTAVYRDVRGSEWSEVVIKAS